MVDAKPKVLFTDGEGPLVFKDLARDISRRLFPNNFSYEYLSGRLSSEVKKQKMKLYEDRIKLSMLSINSSRGKNSHEFSI